MEEHAAVAAAVKYVRRLGGKQRKGERKRDGRGDTEANERRG